MSLGINLSLLHYPILIPTYSPVDEAASSFHAQLLGSIQRAPLSAHKPIEKPWITTDTKICIDNL
eukprot:12890533-Prorocentrum_lima.AAC.1